MRWMERWWIGGSRERYHALLQKTDLNAMQDLPKESKDGAEQAREHALYQWLDDYDLLLNNYKLAEIAPGPDDFSRAVQLLDWISAHTYYYGLQTTPLPDSTPAILRFAYDRSFRHAINCRDKAIVMTDCLLALQAKAYPICMNPNGGCHFMVHVYLRELGKWAVFDPSFHTYFEDEAHAPLSVLELRELMRKGREPSFPGYALNGSPDLQDVYIHAFVRSNLGSLSTWRDNSPAGRASKNPMKRKAFSCALPVGEAAEMPG